MGVSVDEDVTVRERVSVTLILILILTIILTLTLTPHPHPNPNPLPQKYNRSMQDQTLHPAQPTSQPAQFHEQISARITVKSFLKIVVFLLKILLFLR